MILFETDVQRLKDLLREQPRTADTPSREVLKQVDLCAFWGSRIWVATDDRGGLLSFNMTKLGKRKKNVWEPYANWYLAYTIPEARRRGHATALSRVMRSAAVEAGCVRLRSLAGSWAGFSLHVALGDAFWGLTDRMEVVVDSPLVEKAWPNTIPGAVRNACADPLRLTPEDVFTLTGGKLHYDR